MRPPRARLGHSATGHRVARLAIATAHVLRPLVLAQGLAQLLAPPRLAARQSTAGGGLDESRRSLALKSA